MIWYKSSKFYLSVFLITVVIAGVMVMHSAYSRFAKPLIKETIVRMKQNYECPPSTVANEYPEPVEVKGNTRRHKYEAVISDYIEQVNPRLGKSYISDLTNAIIHHSLVADYDPLLTTAIIKHESTFRNTCVGGAGERGLMQVHPCHRQFTRSKLFEINYNIQSGLTVLRNHQRSAHGNLARALSGYTGGRSGRYSRTWQTLKHNLNTLGD